MDVIVIDMLLHRVCSYMIRTHNISSYSTFQHVNVKDEHSKFCNKQLIMEESQVLMNETLEVWREIPLCNCIQGHTAAYCLAKTAIAINSI